MLGNYAELFSKLCSSIQYYVQMAKARVYFQKYFFIICSSFLHQARDQLLTVTLLSECRGQNTTREAKYL